MHREFWESGLRVFGLYGAHKDANGGIVCDCGNTNCKAPLKHPISANWQHTPEWDEEQIEAMEMAGQFATGFGVLCKGLLVVDVDARNGGIASWHKLAETVPDVAQAGMIVETGSGGGSRHLYFRAPDGVAMLQHHPDYPGLDFKSSGYVVGPGSRHASGNLYTLAYGGPDDLEDAPQSLVDLLRRPDRHRADFDGRSIDVTHDDLAEMIAAVDPDCDYDTWIRCGMALHHATGGTGFAVWDEWSARGAKYDDKGMDAHWHSFGRCANPVTIGTLIHHAENGGWKMPVSFTPDPALDFGDDLPAHDAPRKDGLPFDISGVDLTAPPGFAGELARWIFSQGKRPRKHLAVAASIIGLGNVAGLRYTDDRDGVNCNLFVFGVAGSGTGKEAIQQALADVHRAAGLSPATHGAIKSEQEIVKNLIRHQAALYIIDEIGSLLKKIKNAQKSGSAAYLDGVIGMLMAAYSKADGFMLLTGDAKEDVRAALMKEAAQINKRIDAEGSSGALKKKLDALQYAMEGLDKGLERPFLSMIGFTTPVDFDELVDYQSATNGFIGRSLIFNERNTTPPIRLRHKKPPMPNEIAHTIAKIYGAGDFDMMGGERVEYYGKRYQIPTDARAHDMLDDVSIWFDEMAVMHKSKTGMEALYMRAYESVAKVSLILAVPEGRRTQEHVRWAFALALRDVDEKAKLAFANDREKDRPRDALRARIENIISDEGETFGVICNRIRKAKREDVQSTLDDMVAQGVASKEARKHPITGREAVLYRLT